MMEGFEYKVVRSKEIWLQYEDSQIEYTQKYLNTLGIEGWELIIVDSNMAIFKRKLDNKFPLICGSCGMRHWPDKACKIN